MGSNIEIVLIALVAVFLVLRLRAVLGKRTGGEQPPAQDPFAPTAPPVDARTPAGTAPPPAGGEPVRPMAPPAKIAAAAAEAVEKIAAADRSFEPRGFATGARAAFEMIVGAFAKPDVALLKPLLDEATYRSFETAVRDRQAARHVLETSLVGFISSDIVDARMDDSRAFVTVRFVTEQINVTRGADGLVVDGNPNAVETVRDVWTFARDTRSGDPNWLLVKTDSEA